MILLKYDDYTATFDGERWISDDVDFELALNSSWDEAEVTAYTQYRVGPHGTVGLDAVALEAAMKFLDSVEVVANQPVMPQPEEEGVVV